MLLREELPIYKGKVSLFMQTGQVLWGQRIEFLPIYRDEISESSIFSINRVTHMLLTKKI